MIDSNQEDMLFQLLSKNSIKQKKINWDSEYLPNPFNFNNVEINYLDEDYWFFRYKNNNGITYYFFGVEIENDYFLRLVLNSSNSNLKTLKSDKLYIFFKIMGGNEYNVKEFLDNNFVFKKNPKFEGKYYVLLGKFDSLDLIENIKKLLKTIIFDLNITNSVLTMVDLNNALIINNDKIIVEKRFKNELKNYEHIISESDMLKLKSKYNKGYFSFYNSLNFDNLIKTHNNEFIQKEKPIMLKKFKKELGSFKGFITESENSNLKSKYNKEYYHFYDEGRYKNLVSFRNTKIILNKFDEILSNNVGFIDKIEKEKLEKEFKIDNVDYFNKLGLNEKVLKYNNKFIEEEKNKILKSFEGRYVPQSEKNKIKESILFEWDLDDIVDEHNNEFIETQRRIDGEFFDHIVGRSLDINQRVAVLTDDDNTQIVAGAGTGKTLTIQAKVKYLIEKQGILPEDILCISFSNSARDDLAEKLEKTIGNQPVDVRTFHSLGYKILGINGYDREVPKYELNHLIDNHFKEHFTNHPQEVIEFFSYYFNLIHLNADNLKLETIKSKLNSLDEYDEYLQEYLQITNFKRKKEYMNSINELIIANYLFIHNINYEEGHQLIFKNKKYNTYLSNFSNFLFLDKSQFIPEKIKKQLTEEIITDFEQDFGYKKCDYYPKFYLPEYDIFIDADPLIDYNWSEKFADDEKQDLVVKITERSKFNNSYDTELITIFNYQDNVEDLLDNLENNLMKNGVIINEAPWDELYDLLILKENLPEYGVFISTIERFINLFKGNAKNIDENGEDISKEMFNKYLKENNQRFALSIEKRNKFFLNIIEKIYQLYDVYLKENDYIDFNDMINEAVIALKNGAHIHNYKYVIVDEYQDTSHTRYNLLKEVKNATDAKLVVVGDDWQSIYGFTGCDVNLFSKFEDYFENPKRVTINITRRNSQKLIDVVGEFIQKNKNQIPKKLKSDKLNDDPIRIFEYSSRAEQILALINILNEISEEKEDAEILILGRNNNDINQILCDEIFSTKGFKDYTKIIYEQKKNLNIKFRTVHKSKGLQADYVVVLNLNDQINGFPNKIVNDPILDFVNNIQNENIDYPEERRLFYVALTRTKKDVYLFARDTRPSIFVKEIKNKKSVKKLNYVFSNDDIIKINKLLKNKFEVLETDNVCPNCNAGKINLIINNERGTSYFKCSNFCGWNGGPYHNSSNKRGGRNISHVKYAEVCPNHDGMLIVKLNKNNKYFLGCNNWPNCEEAKSLPIRFKKDQENIPSPFDLNLTSEIKRTQFGVYYIDKYIPRDKQEEYESEDLEFSHKIWDYKDDEEYSVSLFTRDLMEFISLVFDEKIANNVDKLALMAVPSSKVKRFKKSSMRKSIDLIEDWSKNGQLSSEFNFDKQIINYKDLFKRVTDVPTAHLGEGRATLEEHFDSIECMKNNLSNDNIAYLVLDDITTTGNSMGACNQHLLNSGVYDKNIYNIALGATVRDKDEKI